MTKKDYELVAECIQGMHAINKLTERERTLLNALSVKLAYRMKHDNAGFKPEKFIVACGFDPTP